MNRNNKSNTNLNLFEGWDHIFFDNLSDDETKITDRILALNSK